MIKHCLSRGVFDPGEHSQTGHQLERFGRAGVSEISVEKRHLRDMCIEFTESMVCGERQCEARETHHIREKEPREGVIKIQVRYHIQSQKEHENRHNVNNKWLLPPTINNTRNATNVRCGWGILMMPS